MDKKLRNCAFVTGILAVLIGFGVARVEAKTLLGDYLKEKNINVEIAVGMDIYDKYVWRGMLLDKDAVLQPSFTISVYGFEGGFWGSWDLESKDNLSSDEVDGWIGYAFDLGWMKEGLEIIKVALGHTWYDFPAAGTYSKEFYFKSSLDVFLSPYFAWYRDYADEENGGADGNYFMVGIGHSFSLLEEYGITLDLGGELNYNNGAFINGEGGYAMATMGVSIPLAGELVMTPKLAYVVPYDDLAHESDGNHREQLYGGCAFFMKF